MPLRPLPYRQVERRRLRAARFVPGEAIGTLRSIVRQAGLTVAEFEALGD
jgi:hypothetical protein